jgi:hypothetical protein
MGYEVDYAAAEEKGCSSRLTIADRIFYVKLFQPSQQQARYFAGDQRGVITKEISRNEFDFWLRTLADKKTDFEDIAKKIGQGKKYSK